MTDRSGTQLPTSPPTPPFSSPPAAPLGAVAPPRKRRGDWWVWAAVVASVLAAGAWVFITLAGSTWSNRLLDADFEHGAAPFKTGTTTEYRFDVVDGTYRISATTAPNAPAAAFAWFAHSASTVEIAADVVAVDEATTRTGVGVGCNDEPKKNNHGYLFLVTPIGYGLYKLDVPNADLLVSTDTTHEWPGTSQRIGITCRPTSHLAGAPVEVRGLVDGVEVIRTTEAGGFANYRTAVLYLANDQAGTSVRFDNVVATVSTAVSAP